MYMKKILVLFVALFIGCSETASGPSISSIIMPLAVGNEWVSESTRYDKNSNPIVRIDTFKIISKAIENGIEVFYSNLDDPYYFANNTLYTIVDSLPWFIVQPPKFLNEVVRNDTFVIAERDSYGNPTGQYSTMYLRQWVSTIDTTITVKAGTFQCLGYTTLSYTPKYGYKSSGKSFYSTGIGLIKSESYQDTVPTQDDLDGIRQLISYHLN
jgi:hypothetical protein